MPSDDSDTRISCLYRQSPVGSRVIYVHSLDLTVYYVLIKYLARARALFRPADWSSYSSPPSLSFSLKLEIEITFSRALADPALARLSTEMCTARRRGRSADRRRRDSTSDIRARTFGRI